MYLVPFQPDYIVYSLQTQLMKDLPPSISEMIPQACGKGASIWLTGLPYEKYGFVLNKLGFKDAIALRYALPIANIAKNCKWSSCCSFADFSTTNLSLFLPFHLFDGVANLFFNLSTTAWRSNIVDQSVRND